MRRDLYAAKGIILSRGVVMRTIVNGKPIDISAITGNIKSVKADLLVVGMFEDKRFEPLLRVLDRALKGEIGKVVKAGEFTGEFGQSAGISSLSALGARKLLLVGLGKRERYNLEILRRVAAYGARAGRLLLMKSVALALPTPKASATETGQAAAEGALLGLYRFVQYKTVDKEKLKELQHVTIICNKNDVKELTAGIGEACKIAEAVNWVRDIVNMPASERPPKRVAAEALTLRKFGVKVKVLGRNEIEKAGMGGLAGVSRGSAQEPQFIVAEWRGRGPTVALVGKGVTFDSGGLDIKARNSMTTMRGDVAGAAAVLGALKLSAQARLPLRVIAVLPVCENMPGGKAYKPGDILTAYNKKTMEIADTDAEGRLILADALSYADKLRPTAIIDLATLTGACVVALGYEAAGVMGDAKLVAKAKTSGEATNERVWEFPLWDEYKEKVKSDIADVRNIPKGEGWEAGAIAGGAFLSNFVTKTWAHIDIAGPSWLPEDSFYATKGATGWGVRLLYAMLKKWKA